MSLDDVSTPKRRRVRRARQWRPAFHAALLGLVLAPHGVLADDLPGDAVAPAPGLSPAEVVRIQLEALRHNDDLDRGIEVAFRFASPSNKRSTGPLPRFARMIKTGPYALMLGYQSAAYEDVEISGDRARQRVTLIGPGGATGYEFFLSRQVHAECQGCWMTDAVTVVRVAAVPA